MQKRYARQDDYNDAITEASARYDVPVALIKAIIARESEFNPRAYRAEPKLGDASRGLMQMLYSTARWLGYSGQPDGLYDPDVSIDLGTHYLGDNVRTARAHGYGLDSAIAIYNGGESKERPGDGRRTASSRSAPFISQGYVDWVLEAMQYFAEWDAQQATSSGPSAVGASTQAGRGRPAAAAAAAGVVGAAAAVALLIHGGR